MKINVKKIVKTGTDLWNKYGNTVNEVAEKVKQQIEDTKARKESGEAPKSTLETGKEMLGLYGNTVINAVNTATDGKYRDTIGIVSQVVENVIPENNMGNVNLDEGVEEVDTEEVPAEVDGEEDTFFEDSTSKLSDAVKAAANGGFQDPEAVMNALCALGEVANDTVKYVAEQETKQEEIRAQRDVAIAQINATSECIKAYLEKTFDERSAIFSKQFEVVDEALRTGNTEMLAMSLQSINALAAQSPFKNLADIGQVKQALTTGDTEWDI
jgi:hypothetical protein